MTSEKTTIIVVLLAGDTNTTNQLDRLLYGVQEGVKSFVGKNPPAVFCLYHRLTPERTIESHYYQIRDDTLTFDSNRFLDASSYPPPACIAHRVEGTLAEKIGQFLRCITLPCNGPIRVIFGGHGYPPSGLSSTFFQQLPKVIWRFLKNGGVSLLSPVGWPNRIRILYRQFFADRMPPGAIRSSGGSNFPEILLDDITCAFPQSYRTRLQMLVLHSCTLSSVESMCALRIFEFKIACESDLYHHLQVEDWFKTLSKPASTNCELTKECFRSMVSNLADPESVQGVFSSHLTDEASVTRLLTLLGRLGRQLHDKLMHDSTSVLTAVESARLAASVSQYEVDVTYFCDQLKNLKTVDAGTLESIVDFIHCLQVALPIRVNLSIPNNYNNFQGISLFLPAPTYSTYKSTDLPSSFQNLAQDWCQFLDEWISLTANGVPRRGGTVVAE